MTIIHIGRGFGFLVLVFFFGCLWETQSIVAEKFGQIYPFHHIWVMGVATLASAPMCLLAGWFLYDRNAEVQADPITHKEVVIRSHTYLYMPLLWWGFILFAVGFGLLAYDFREFGQKVFGAKGAGQLETQGSRGSSNPLQSQLTEPKLTSIVQLGPDIHADLHVQQKWIDEGQKIHVTIPNGRSIQIQLSSSMTEGVQLRLKGQAGVDKGDLYLVVRISK